MKGRHLHKSGAVLFCVGLVALLLWANRPTPPVTRNFSGLGVKTVVLRASEARIVKVLPGKTSQIQLSGLPVGGAQGYHSPDPFWRETAARDWGLDFVARRSGNVLVVSTSHEILYIHHHYVLTSLSIEVPTGVKVIKEERKLSGDGQPDLTAPN